MAQERTLSIIKPDAVGKNVIGDIVGRFEKAGLKVIAMRMETDIFTRLFAQHRLYFCPLPQGQGMFRPIAAISIV